MVLHFFAFLTSQQNNELTITDLQKTLIRQLGQWNFVENHSNCVFPQVHIFFKNLSWILYLYIFKKMLSLYIQILQSASETYRCVDTFHCRRDNAIYIICHHAMSPHRSCKEFWNTSLHTDVGFRYPTIQFCNSFYDYFNTGQIYFINLI